MQIVPGEQWPPKSERDRMARYASYRDFFKGRHPHKLRYLARFLDTDSTLGKKISLVLNYPQLITRAAADILCGEAPKFVIVGGEPVQREALQVALDKICSENELTKVLYEFATACSWRGDGVWRNRDNGKRIVIEQVPASSYVAQLDPDNDQEAISQVIAWPREWQGRWILRVEEHFPGYVLNSAFWLEKQGLSGHKIGQQIPISEIYPEMSPFNVVSVQQTQVPEPLVWHVPNYSDGESYWGISDYAGGLDTLFEAVNNRITKIDSYLDKHQRPILLGFPGMADQEQKVDAQRDYYEPNSPEQAAMLRYVTWDGQMQAAFRELDELKTQIRVQSETPKRLLGESEDSSIDSSRAMLNDFIPITKKVNRKKLFVDPILRKVLYQALQLNAIRYDGPSPEGYQVDIVWADGVPQDYMEIVQTEAIRVQNGLSSRQKSIERIDLVTTDEAQQELARIESEQTQPSLVGDSPGPAGDNPAMTGESDANAGRQPGTAGYPTAGGLAAASAPGSRS